MSSLSPEETVTNNIRKMPAVMMLTAIAVSVIAMSVAIPLIIIMFMGLLIDHAIIPICLIPVLLVMRAANPDPENEYTRKLLDAICYRPCVKFMVNCYFDYARLSREEDPSVAAALHAKLNQPETSTV